MLPLLDHRPKREKVFVGSSMRGRAGSVDRVATNTNAQGAEARTPCSGASSNAMGKRDDASEGGKDVPFSK